MKYETPEEAEPVPTVQDLAGTYMPLKQVQNVRGGLPLKRALALKAVFGFSDEQLAVALGISRATFMRMKRNQSALTPDQGDRVIRFERLFTKALAVFEEEPLVRQWFATPAYGLNGETPLHFAETEVGAREVETLLERLEYGVYA